MKHRKGPPVMRFDFEWHPLKAKENAEKRQEKSTTTTRSKPMKEEYDFSRGERGKFHTQDAVFNLPVYLDEDNRAFVEEVNLEPVARIGVGYEERTGQEMS